MSKNQAANAKAPQRESTQEPPWTSNLEKADGTAPAEGQLPARVRVLEAACELFAQDGFHGTHLREICKRAGTNPTGVYCHFQSKEGLYQAVIMEAGRQLAADDGSFAASRHLPHEQRLQKTIDSLLQKLGSKRAWIAKLLSRELMDEVGGVQNYVACGIERDFIQLQAVMSDFLGLKACTDNTRLQALSVVGECVLYCLKGENRRHAFPSAVCLPSRAHQAQFLARRSLGALRAEEVKPEGTTNHPIQ
jgi:AcrR family transcriptional regulator